MRRIFKNNNDIEVVCENCLRKKYLDKLIVDLQEDSGAYASGVSNIDDIVNLMVFACRSNIDNIIKKLDKCGQTWKEVKTYEDYVQLYMDIYEGRFDTCGANELELEEIEDKMVEVFDRDNVSYERAVKAWFNSGLYMLDGWYETFKIMINELDKKGDE